MTKSGLLDKLYSDRDWLEHALATAGSDADYESISEKLEAVNARIKQLERE
jgi:hypothetical protein